MGASEEEEAALRMLYKEVVRLRKIERDIFSRGNVTNEDGSLNMKALNLRNLALADHDARTELLQDMIESLARTASGVDLSDAPGASEKAAKKRVKALIDKAEAVIKEELERLKDVGGGVLQDD